MTADHAGRGRATALTDRISERGVLDRLVHAVRAGESRVLVVRGDPGVGKTVLLDYLAGRAAGAGCRVARAAGVQWEMELAFAALHQLCRPMLGRAGRLPVPQYDTLRTAFGLAAGPPPDRFLVGLAVLICAGSRRLGLPSVTTFPLFSLCNWQSSRLPADQVAWHRSWPDTLAARSPSRLVR
jgi:hypothetical protein